MLDELRKQVSQKSGWSGTICELNQCEQCDKFTSHYSARSLDGEVLGILNAKPTDPYNWQYLPSKFVALTAAKTFVFKGNPVLGIISCWL